MKLRIKKTCAVICTIFIAVNLFICLMCGPAPDATVKYLISAAGISILLPGFACGCIFHIWNHRK